MRNLVVLGSVLAAGALSVIVALSHPHAHPGDNPPIAIEPDSPPVPAPQPAPEPRPAGGSPLLVEGPATSHAPVEAPLSLTASDGSGLVLAELRASAVVEGPLAFTEIHLAFDNTENRIREGTFKIALPQGASLGRFAMKIGEAWQEGEVVAKERARRVYEDFLHRKQDPALMERGAGNEFTARVFPIPARGRKELVVSYAQELVGGVPYTLPLRGLPELGVLDVSVVASGAGVPQRIHRERVVPAEDFVVAQTPGKAWSAVRSGDLAVATIRPVDEALPDRIRSAVVLVDTSASRALGLRGELETVRTVLHGLGDAGSTGPVVSVAAFDQEVFPVFHGDAKDFGDAEIARVVARRALGASNFARALAWAGDEARRVGATRVVFISDGVATAGDCDATKLASLARALGDSGSQRLDFVTVGGLRDDALAHTLVTAGLPRDGVVAAASDGPTKVAHRLEMETRSSLAVAVEGATWSYPTRLDAVQPGDDVLVYAELPEGMPLRVRVGDGPPRLLATNAADRPLLERAWSGAKIASLEAAERETGKSPDLERRIVDLSTSHRVLSEYTALLVLETDADYARYNIDRATLPEVLTVADGRLTFAKRGATAIASSSVPVRPAAAPIAQAAKADERETSPVEALRSPEPPPAREVAATAAVQAELAPPAPAAPMAATGARSTDSDTLGLDGLSGHGGAGVAAGGGVGLARAVRARGEEGAMGLPAAAPLASSAPASRPMALAESAVASEEPRIDPYTGQFKAIKGHLAQRDARGAYALAGAWQAAEPGGLLALTALGESAEAIGDPHLAARAYGSIIDLFPSRADLRRFAGERIERLEGSEALDLAIDTFDKARRDRPDHPSGHRLAAFARVRRGDYAGAFDVLLAALARRYPEGRFPGVDRILREDMGLVAAAWMKAEPKRSDEIRARLQSAGGSVEDRPSIRFVLNWETDANDVDFHIRDARGGHAFFSSPHLASGGDLYADVTTGYGPECFVIRLPRAERAGPYALAAHYYSRGPMGYGMGKVEVIDHDGRGGLKFDERPFVVMADHAFVDLGTVQ